jgi:non-canonical (house-cleaning) NTP pyrophosphatase
MPDNDKEFWSRFQHSADVVVAGRDADQLLGVRDGFRRFLAGLDREMTLSVQPGPTSGEGGALWTTAEDTLGAASRQVVELRRRTDDPAAFCIALEEGLATLHVGSVGRNFLFSWAVIECAVGRACGGSGPIEIPERLTRDADARRSRGMPATRRRGGMLGSLTNGLESRREAFALATLHALSTLLFGLPQPGGSAADGGD